MNYIHLGHHWRPDSSFSYQVEYDGLTGHIEFNSKGQRTNYTLKILEKHPAGHKEVRGQTARGLEIMLVFICRETEVFNSLSKDRTIGQEAHMLCPLAVCPQSFTGLSSKSMQTDCVHVFWFMTSD